MSSTISTSDINYENSSLKSRTSYTNSLVNNKVFEKYIIEKKRRIIR